MSFDHFNLKSMEEVFLQFFTLIKHSKVTVEHYQVLKLFNYKLWVIKKETSSSITLLYLWSDFFFGNKTRKSLPFLPQW